MFVDTFIRRPILATVCSPVIILAGAIAIPTLPIAQYPKLAPPQVTVSAFYTGASAQTVETAVTTPLEQAINGVEGMQYMTSSSTNDGSRAITVTFDITRNLDIAAVDVQNRVTQALGRLPNEVRTDWRHRHEAVRPASCWPSASTPSTAQYDSLFISNYLDVYVRDALKRVPGVGDVIIFGERKYAMRLWLDPDRAGRAAASPPRRRRRAARAERPDRGRQVGQPPAPSRTRPYQISVRAVGRLTEPAEFDNIILKSGADGTLVRAEGRRPRRARRRELHAAICASTAATRSASASCSSRPPTRSTSTDDVRQAELDRLGAASRPA